MGIDFLSTAFDDESIDFLYSIDVPRWKIPSGEIDNLPYLMKIAALNKPVIISTGMSTLEEIRNAVNVFKDFESSISILHCTSEYPAPFDEINLRAIQTLKSEFKVEVGYSDHTLGIEVSMAAVALGASIIEKHFTLDRNLSGPDHKASLEPEELKKMIMSIRNIELAMGDGIKKPTASEVKNKSLVRKSIVAKKDISKGEKLTDENLTLKRPGTGISPMLWFEILGKIAHKDYHEDEIIEL
jgi:N,N'-diacetyllegionaminate synthase